MALLQVHYSLIDKEEIFEFLCDSFESIEVIKDEPLYQRKTFRVQHEEITKEDKVICPILYEFKGIRPFVIEWDF